MKCNHCGKEAKWVENKEVYGRNFGKSYMIWLCKDCDAYVGCHNNTEIPKGKILAKKDLREARRKAHAFIDPLWQSHKYKRNTVYLRLKEAFGYDVHIGGTETPEQCEEIIKTAKLIFTK
jgi:hypothetical protein